MVLESDNKVYLKWWLQKQKRKLKLSSSWGRYYWQKKCFKGGGMKGKKRFRCFCLVVKSIHRLFGRISSTGVWHWSNSTMFFLKQKELQFSCTPMIGTTKWYRQCQSLECTLIGRYDGVCYQLEKVLRKVKWSSRRWSIGIYISSHMYNWLYFSHFVSGSFFFTMCL